MNVQHWINAQVAGEIEGGISCPSSGSPHHQALSQRTGTLQDKECANLPPIQGRAFYHPSRNPATHLRGLTDRSMRTVSLWVDGSTSTGSRDCGEVSHRQRIRAAGTSRDHSRALPPDAKRPAHRPRSQGECRATQSGVSRRSPSAHSRTLDLNRIRTPEPSEQQDQQPPESPPAIRSDARRSETECNQSLYAINRDTHVDVSHPPTPAPKKTTTTNPGTRP